MIKYTISKHHGIYILWKESHKGTGWACCGIFKGTRKECKLKLKEVIEYAR
jgi:hypothetical protein